MTKSRETIGHVAADVAKKIVVAFGKRDVHFSDRLFKRILRAPAVALILLLMTIGLFLVQGAWPVLRLSPWHFFSSTNWDPVSEDFGVLPVIFGTLASSFLAILISAPLSVGVALFLTELAPNRIGRIVGFLVEMLAAIPSVVYGLWGIFVLAPLLRTTVEPFLGRHFGVLPFFQGPPFGVGMMAAGAILAIMITPTICSISREVFRSIPRMQKEAALGIGATRWEMLRIAVLSSGKKGVFGAIILGLGRALGETMAVTMVIGNRADISASLFAPGQTMASVIANEYSEATNAKHVAALFGVEFALVVVTFIVNALARLLVHEKMGRAVR